MKTQTYIPSQALCDQDQAKAVAKKLFDLYDRDRNGTIDANEIGPMLQDAYRGMGRAFNPNQEDVTQYNEVWDVNKDGRVTYQDVENFALRILVDVYKNIKAGVQPLPNFQMSTYERPKVQFNRVVEERLEVARRLFRKFDVQQTGYLTRNEVPGLLRDTYRQLNIDFEPTTQDVQAWMEMTDTDSDGRVSLQDFEQSIIRSLQDQGIQLY